MTTDGGDILPDDVCFVNGKPSFAMCKISASGNSLLFSLLCDDDWQPPLRGTSAAVFTSTKTVVSSLPRSSSSSIDSSFLTSSLDRF